MTTTFDRLFAGQRVMAVLRGLSIERTLELANAAWDLGIDCVEITIQAPADILSLKEAVQEGALRGKEVGAGTVTTTESMRAAIEAGAAFSVSPAFDPILIDQHRRAGLPHLPGVATPTDVRNATDLGLTWLKAFPAVSLGTAWFSAMNGPFPDVRFVATGGMNAENAGEYLRAGVTVVGVGSALEDPKSLLQLKLLTAGG